MRKSSFGRRLSTSAPLRVRNDNVGPRKSAVGSHTPQGKFSTQQMKSGLSRTTNRNSAGSSGMGLRTSGIGVRNSMSVRNSGTGVRSGGIDVRNSGIGVRGSNIGARGRTDVPKDPRPISDKSYQHRCIRSLIDFLAENKYPHAISPKVLQSPPSKEFYRIFEFVYSHLYPGFKLTGRVEEEVLRVFKSLGYPFAISKSYLHAVGTPHSWPYLLSALVWLVDLVQNTQILTMSATLDHILFPNDDEDFDSVPEDKIIFEYTAQTYGAYLNGEDTYEALDYELSKVLESKYLGQSGGIEAVRAENARIVEEIELLDQEMVRMGKLQEQQQIMLLDERKFRDYLGEVDSVIRKNQQMVQEANDHQASLMLELKSVEGKKQHMQALYEQQEMTPADVERLRATLHELQRQEEALEREEEAISTEIWNKEMAFSRLHEQVESNISEYSKLARSLKLIPETADNAQGINFMLPASCEDMGNKYFENTVMPALNAMKKRSMQMRHQAEAEKLTEDRNIEEFMDNIADMKQEVSQLEKDIQQKEEEIECRKQLYQRDTDAMQESIDKLQQDIRTLEMSSQISLQDAERELREAKFQAEQQKAEMAKREQEYCTFMINVCTLVSDHKMNVQQKLKALDKELKQVLTQAQACAQRVQERSNKLRQQAEADLEMMD